MTVLSLLYLLTVLLFLLLFLIYPSKRDFYLNIAMRFFITLILIPSFMVFEKEWLRQKIEQLSDTQYISDHTLVSENNILFSYDPQRLYFSRLPISSYLRREELIDLPILGSAVYSFRYALFLRPTMGSRGGFFDSLQVDTQPDVYMEDIAILAEYHKEETLLTHEMYHAGLRRLLAKYGIDMMVLHNFRRMPHLIYFDDIPYSFGQVSEYFSVYGVIQKYGSHEAAWQLYALSYSKRAPYDLIHDVFIDLCQQQIDCYLSHAEKIMSLLLAQLPMRE